MATSSRISPLRPVWTQLDFEKLARLFPKDYRPPLYLGLYLLQLSHYSLDFDYQPVLKSFERAAELNPSSPLPSFFSAEPYIVGGIGGLISKGNSTCIDDVVPRTKDCLALDDTHRAGVRPLVLVNLVLVGHGLQLCAVSACSGHSWARFLWLRRLTAKSYQAATNVFDDPCPALRVPKPAAKAVPRHAAHATLQAL